MALIRRQRYGTRTTQKNVTVEDPVSVRGSFHDPDSGTLRSVQFAIQSLATNNDEVFIVSLSREDVETLHTYLLNSEARRLNMNAGRLKGDRQ